MKNPGIIIKLYDGRTVIIYNNQPLVKEKGKIVLHLVDDKFMPILDDTGKTKIIIKDITVYLEEKKSATILGYVN